MSSSLRALRTLSRSSAFSARAYARSAVTPVARPAAVRFASTSSSLSNSGRALLAAAARNGSLSRAFSVSAIARGQGESDISLSQKLAEEITYENEVGAANAAEPEFLQEFRKSGIWTVEESSGHDEVTLIRKFGNETIRVLFSIADVDLSTQPEFEEDGSAASEQEEAPAFPLRCAVTITKANGALSIEAIAQEGVFEIENISFYQDSALAVDLTAEADWKRRGLYIGPQFGHLDASVQEEFDKFLAERGVNESLALFVQEYAEWKEQKEYVQWLGSVKKFIDA